MYNYYIGKKVFQFYPPFKKRWSQKIKELKELKIYNFIHLLRKSGAKK
jgi:hypothetical protein